MIIVFYKQSTVCAQRGSLLKQHKKMCLDEVVVPLPGLLWRSCYCLKAIKIKKSSRNLLKTSGGQQKERLCVDRVDLLR